MYCPGLTDPVDSEFQLSLKQFAVDRFHQQSEHQEQDILDFTSPTTLSASH